MRRDEKNKLAREPHLGPDELEAAKQGKTYFNDQNPEHLQRMTRLWWGAVYSCTSPCVNTPGSKDFEDELRREFMRRAEKEFVLWQSWPAEWAGFMVWRALGGGTDDSEWDEVPMTYEEGGHEIGKIPVPKLKG